MPRDPEKPSGRILPLAIRVLWLVGLVLVYLRFFAPEAQGPIPPTDYLALPGTVDLAAADGPTTGTTAGIHGGLHDLFRNARPTTATLAGRDVLTFDEMARTRIGLRPPPVFTDRVALMDGQRVRLLGFMVPYDSLTDMRNMMLLDTPVGCYFCEPPSPERVAFARIDSPEPVEFVDEAIEVTGTLRLWKKDSNEPAHQMFLFVLDEATFKPARGALYRDRGDI